MSRLFGKGGDDLLGGYLGDDRVFGGSGNDAMFGGDGKDLMRGGLGADRIWGDAGNDRFRYVSIAESGVGAGNRDVISDFGAYRSPHDKIDLHKIDADPDTAADDAFTFVSDAQFSGTAGELRYDDTEGLVQADVNGDGTADFEIAMAPNINDLHPILTIDDFRL